MQSTLSEQDHPQNRYLMNLIILKTNLRTRQHVGQVQHVLNAHPGIGQWTVDTEDRDKVLRLEAAKPLTEIDIIQLLACSGVCCEELPNTIPA